MLVNKNTFNIKSKITDDWGNSHRVALDLKALASAQDWKIEISIPDGYNIREIYGGEITKENGKTYLSGQSWNKSLNQGKETEIILIVDEGDSSNSSPIEPTFIFADSLSSPTPAEANLVTSSSIVEDWHGGYKVELDISAEAKANNWTLDFDLPYEIRAAYGVDLIKNGNGSYSISGQNSQKNLEKGQSIDSVLIIDDGGGDAVNPEFLSVDSPITPDPVVVEKPIIAEKPKVIKKPVIIEEPQDKLIASPVVTEDWHGGYKVELDISAEKRANNWTLDFELPYEIRDAYGVDLVKNGNGSYTISGQNNQKNLVKGQSIESVLIIDDGGGNAVKPNFESSTVIPPVIIEDNPGDNGDDNGNGDDNDNPVIEIPDDDGKRVGQQGKFAYGEALQKNFLFLEANRSGSLGPDNRLEWRSDSTTNDGSRVGRDLEGGYFDAGDHVKFGQPMAASVNMLAWGGVEYTDAYKQAGQFDELLESVKWGTDYFLKAHETSNGKTSKLWVQVGEGGSGNDHGYWGAPETVEANTTRNAFYIDANNPGSDVAASTSSALAAASMLFRGVDNQYADELLKNAKQLYTFAETYQGKYSDSVSAANPFYTSWSGYGDELASGAAWLYKATGEKSYLNKAENHFKTRIGGLGDWSWAVDDHSYGAAVILAQESDDSFFKGQVEGWLNRWINGGGNIKYTSGGFAHRAAWGSVPVTSSAAYLAQLYNDTVKEDKRYSDFATKQMDYMLGDNPVGLSYMVGFGDKYPQSPHHRGSAPNLNSSAHAPMENILFGAVVGGPSRADDYSHNDSRHDWVTNEVGTSYNAPFASALIQQYDNLGGDPLTEAELDLLPGVDANGVGF